ncbi:MAG: 4Fe-4S binding protein [Tissierellia bacterium]|nr:4Fe-4S binding protein [Tissierellia bacterium]
MALDRQKRRHAIQALGTLVLNGNLKGFTSGRIYEGATKSFCVPVLNCYSCPGALGACPIGSLQAVAGSPGKSIGLYVVGLIALFGLLLGRWFCGYLCPFGLIQEILYAIPVPKVKVPKKMHGVLKYLKYIMLFIPVLLLPAVLTDQWGFGAPMFCKFVCPAGLVEGGLPLMAKHPELFSSLGSVFIIKATVTIVVVVASILIMRPFCKYLCPMGAALGCFNGVSLYRMEVSSACITCNACVKNCPMDLVPYETPNSAECIRCKKCIQVCPVNALSMEKLGGVRSEENNI